MEKGYPDVPTGHAIFQFRSTSSAQPFSMQRCWKPPICLYLVIGLLATYLLIPVSTASQTPRSSSIAITPSALTMRVGDIETFSVVDSTGSPLREAVWSLDPNIADLTVNRDGATLSAVRGGEAVLTASTPAGSGATKISIIAGADFRPGTVRWSLDPARGYEFLTTVEAVSTQHPVAIYAIEWSKTSNAIVRALTPGGAQIWKKELDATASPDSLKLLLPPVAETIMNDQRISDHTQVIIGDQNAMFAANNPSNPSHYGLPPDGKYILTRICGADDGGIYLLERGRYHDRIVKLDPSDGSQTWAYLSAGHFMDSWTVNTSDDVAIVETVAEPPSSAFLIIEGTTGVLKTRVAFPPSSSTVTGLRCSDPMQNTLANLRPSVAGSPFTASTGDMYLQVQVHVESEEFEACQPKQYSFDEKLELLRVTPEGKAEWKTFEHTHAEGSGGFVVQNRMFAGETIPDGFGGVLAAWTYLDVHTKPKEPISSEARISRITAHDQRDFTLPMPFWTPGLNSFFSANMVLGDGNILYATNGLVLVRFDTKTGLVDWVRRPPVGKIILDHATAGGILIVNDGYLAYLDSSGKGFHFPWGMATENTDDVGLARNNIFDGTPEAPLNLREIEYFPNQDYVAVEEGAPKGRGSLLFFTAR
jgi:hypothetical protein